MEKKNIQTIESANQVENKANKAANKVQAPTKKVDAAAELQAEIERKTQELQKCLAELERKKQLSDNRSKFINALDALEDAAEKLNQESDFETKAYRLTFADINNYREDAIFKISNTAVLQEIIILIQAKVKERIAEIEKQLIEA